MSLDKNKLPPPFVPKGNYVRREGKKFNLLTTLYPVGKNGKRLLWLCRCDCGNYTTVTSLNLREGRGAIKSCGCIQEGQNAFEVTPDGVQLFLVSHRTHVKYVAWVDEEDFELVSKYRWSAVRGGNTFYAVHKFAENRNATNMHRYLLEAHGFKLDGVFIDHKNRNGLDNRKVNLRVATRAQNVSNQEVRKTATFGYKGVYRAPGCVSRPYRVYIAASGSRHYVGMFKTPEAAALAYNAAARKYHRDFACLNKVSIAVNRRIPLEVYDGAC